MGTTGRIKLRRLGVNSWSVNRDFKVGFSWLKVSSVWMFIVFGFYGWGTPTFANFFSIPYVLTNISILLVFFVYFVSGEYFNFNAREYFLIKYRQVYTAFGILSLLCIVNSNWIFRTLTGDEIAYALQSQAQSYVLMKKAIEVFPQIGDLPFRLLLQFSSGAILLFLFVVGRLAFKIRNTRHFILLTFVATLIFRVAAISQGGLNGSNPPGASFYYLIGSTILSPTSPSYRILSLLLASIFLTVIYEHLKKIASLHKHIRVLIILVLISLPLFRHMSLLVEISVWTFYFATLILLQVYRSGVRISYRQTSLIAIATTFRFPLIAILFAALSAALFNSAKQRGKDVKVLDLGGVILGGLLSLPGIVFVGATRLAERINAGSISNGQVDAPFSDVGEISEDIFSTFSLTTHKLYWLVSLIGIIFFVKKSLAGFIFMSLYVATNFTLFFILNTSDVISGSKYVIEWFGPLVVLGIIAITKSQPKARNVNSLVTVILLIVITTNVIDYNRIPSKFIATTPALQSGSSNELNDIYRVVASVPFPYAEAFKELKGNQDLAECLNLGVVYGVYQQVMAGYTGTNILRSLDLVHKYLLAQEQLYESWITSSHESIALSGSHCVLIGFVDGQSEIVRGLLANKWKIRHSYTDLRYKTRVYVMTR